MSGQKKRPNNMQKVTQRQRNFGMWFTLLVIVIFLVFGSRFFYIAFSKNVSGHNLTEEARKLYLSTNEIKAKRGSIYDNAGQAIVEDTKRYSIYIVLSKVKNANGLQDNKKEQAAVILNKYLGISKESLLAYFNTPMAYQVEVGNKGKNISLSTKSSIELEMKKNNIHGIHFTSFADRLYPNGTFASHLIGVTSKSKDGTLYGTMGLEAVFNNILSGKNGVNKEALDARGIKLNNIKEKSVKAKNGSDIYTTLDSRTQLYLESLLMQAQNTYHPKVINAILMNAKTGAIIAASQRPTFNPQTKDGISDQWKNTLLEDTYEPGSVMKILTMAAAIDSGNYNASAYYKSGTMKVGTQQVTDWVPSGWGYLTYRQGFIRSSNVGMAKLEEKMGAKLWEKYIKKFGLLKSTNSGLSNNESSGSIEFKYPIEQANTAFGQGINVTPFQVVQAISAVANDGVMVKPYLIKKIVDSTTGKVLKTGKKTVVGKPISAQSAKQVREMMREVVTSKEGTGQSYKISGYDIGVKTGTAQIASSSGGYLTGDTNYVFSVAGMAPLNNPKYILYITMKQPQTFAGKEATQMLAGIFNPLMKRILDRSKDESQTATTVKLTNMVGENPSIMRKKLTQSGLIVTTIGNGTKIVKQSIAANKTVLLGQRIILLTNKNQTLPDLKGWSRADVLKLQQLTKLKINLKGSGYVASQNVKAGSALNKINQLEVILK